MGACVHARTHAYTYITPGVHQFALALDARAPPGERLRHRRAHIINEERAAAALVREGGREGGMVQGRMQRRKRRRRKRRVGTRDATSQLSPAPPSPAQPASQSSKPGQSIQPASLLSQSSLVACVLPRPCPAGYIAPKKISISRYALGPQESGQEGSQGISYLRTRTGIYIDVRVY